MTHIRQIRGLDNATTTVPRREGVVLVAVLIVIVVLSLAAYQYSELMVAEFKANDNYHRAAQAKALADSGLHYAAALLANQENIVKLLDGNPYDNPERFGNVAVQDYDKRNYAGFFKLVGPLDPEDSSTLPYRVGVSDEGGKINLKALIKIDPTGKQLLDMLMKLP